MSSRDVSSDDCERCAPRRGPQAAELEAVVAAAQSALERQRKGHEEALAALEAQHKLQSRKIASDADTEKKTVQVCGSARSRSRPS